MLFICKYVTSLASRDPFTLSTARNGEVSLSIFQRLLSSKSSSINLNPNPIPPFTPRPPMQIIEFSPSAQTPEEKILYPFSRSQPAPIQISQNCLVAFACELPLRARFRLWLKEARKRRRHHCYITPTSRRRSPPLLQSLSPTLIQFVFVEDFLPQTE